MDTVKFRALEASIYRPIDVVCRSAILQYYHSPNTLVRNFYMVRRPIMLKIGLMHDENLTYDCVAPLKNQVLNIRNCSRQAKNDC